MWFGRTMTRKNPFYFVLICSLFHAFGTCAQPGIVRFEHFNLEDGLSQGSVYCMLQDQKGFLWFGTQDGLNKYDGYEFNVYRHDKYDSSSLSDNCVNALYEDTDGYLWIGTLSGGLNRLNRRTNTFQSYQAVEDDAHSLSSNTVTSVFQDHRGRIWVGTDDGLNLMEGDGFIRFHHDPSVPFTINASHITCIFEDRDQNLWIGTTSGLNLFDHATQTFRPYPLHTEANHGKSSHITTLYEDHKGNLFVGTLGEGLLAHKPATGQGISSGFSSINFAGIQLNEVSTILSDPAGNIWIGFQEEGLVRWNPETGEYMHYRANSVQSNSLSNDRVSALFRDKFGNLWIGTLNGINKLNLSNRKFVVYQNRPGIQGDIDNSVFAIAMDDDEKIWTGTRGGLFTMTREQEISEYLHRPGSSDKRQDAIRSIYKDSKGTMWIGTEKGTLETLDLRTGRFQAIAIDTYRRENPIYVIRQDADDFLWLGTLEGLYRVDPLSMQVRHYDWQESIQAGTRRREIRSIELDEKNNLWIGTRGAGLFYFDRHDGTFVNRLNNPADSFS